MTLRHYYHVYAVEGWESVVGEHLDAIMHSGLHHAFETDGFHIGVVGDYDERNKVVDFCRQRLPTIVVAMMDRGFEQVTLNAMRRWERIFPFDGSILYAHTKGVSDPSAINVAWRHSMETKLVYEWTEALRWLSAPNTDAVGCHWLTPETYPDMVTIPFFGGNWWWANASFIRGLDPVSDESRWEAEAWLGRGNPTTFDLLPGWPGFNIFAA